MRLRLIILGIAALVLILIAVGAYFLFFRGEASLIVGGQFGGAGDRDPNSLGPVPETGVPVEGAGTVVAPRLLKLADGPVAKGSVALFIPPTRTSTTSASTTDASTMPEVEVRYIERQSGNIYGFKVHDRTATRLSNKTLPGIQEAAWLSDGSRAFVRFLEEDSGGIEHVSTYMLPVNGEGGYFLEQDLAEVRTASSSVLALYSSSSGSVASVAGRDGTAGKTIFNSNLSSLHVQFAGSSYIATTKGTVALDGYAFLVDKAGTFSRLLGPLRGLATLPNPTGSQVLYTYADRGKLYMQVLDVAKRTAVPLPLVTLAEKCAWNPAGDTLYCAVPMNIRGTFPDDWYQGAYTFTDRLWRIDLSSRVATLLFDPAELAGEVMDVESITLDSASDVLVFMNRIDGSLWSYDL